MVFVSFTKKLVNGHHFTLYYMTVDKSKNWNYTLYDWSVKDQKFLKSKWCKVAILTIEELNKVYTVKHSIK